MIALDVGSNQLSWNLRNNSDVICLEKIWNYLVENLDNKLNKRYSIKNDIYKIIDYIQIKI